MKLITIPIYESVTMKIFKHIKSFFFYIGIYIFSRILSDIFNIHVIFFYVGILFLLYFYNQYRRRNEYK